VDIKVLGTAEPAVTIIAASIPILRAFIRKDAPARTRSIPFVEFSQIPEPSSQSLSSTKEYPVEGLVRYNTTPARVTVHDV
jgi:hypothetical protein